MSGSVGGERAGRGAGISIGTPEVAKDPIDHRRLLDERGR